MAIFQPAHIFYIYHLNWTEQNTVLSVCQHIIKICRISLPSFVGTVAWICFNLVSLKTSFFYLSDACFIEFVVWVSKVCMADELDYYPIAITLLSRRRVLSPEDRMQACALNQKAIINQLTRGIEMVEIWSKSTHYFSCSGQYCVRILSLSHISVCYIF